MGLPRHIAEQSVQVSVFGSGHCALTCPFIFRRTLIMRRLIPGSALLVVAAGIWVLPLHASANSDSGCVNAPPEACKTVQLDGAGKLTTPTTSGTITFYGG